MHKQTIHCTRTISERWSLINNIRVSQAQIYSTWQVFRGSAHRYTTARSMKKIVAKEHTKFSYSPSFICHRSLCSVSSNLTCWKCGGHVKRSDFFCAVPTCGVILPISVADLSTNLFAVFAMPQAFTIDIKLLDKQFKIKQSLLHPDKFATMSEYERNLSTQSSAAINQAYETLRTPLSRAEYLLHNVFGVDLQKEGTLNTAGTLFEDIFDLQEAVNNATEKAELEGLLFEIKTSMEEFESKADAIFTTQELHKRTSTDLAVEKVTKYRYNCKARDEVAEKIASLCGN